MKYLTVPLASAHKRTAFNSGSSLLDNYLRKQAGQDTKRKLSACFILSDEADNVKGYYTLSSASIEREILPDKIIKVLPPSYKDLPVTLLGRLARDIQFKGKGIGELLLLDAIKRSYEASHSVGSIALIVDPINESAIKFYSKYGFISLPSSGKMFLTMKTISNLFE